MIKCSLRQNLKYPLQLLLWNVLRDIEVILISVFFNFNDSLLYTPIMFLGELSAGLILYLYEKQFLPKYQKQEQRRARSKSIILIHSKHKFAKDSNKKIFFLIFYGSLCDFVQFILSLHFAKFINISGSIESRLRGFFTIYNALFYYYILRFPMYKHQILSLVTIGICNLIVIIAEFFFQEINIFLSYGQFILVFFFIFIIQFVSATVESIEKYLFEYNKSSPYLVLMLEGVFGFILTIIYSLFYNPFNDINQFKKNNSSSNFAILILALILYLILSGLKNSFRVLTTKIYTPMTTTFMDYILNPFYLIYYYFGGKDFISFGERNLTYFLINLILSIILTFIGCVYNEFLILFFCGLERETHREITVRSFSEIELNNNYIQENDLNIMN